MSVETPANPAPPAPKPSVWAGFREFLMRGNVVELAVAVVVGTAFSKIVDAIVKGLINPLVGAIGSQDLEKYQSCLTATCKTDPATGEVVEGIPISWGPIVSASLTFLITAAVVYFLMILPMNKYKEHRAAKLPAEEPAPTEIELLTQIRDALVPVQREAAEAEEAAALAAQRGPVSTEK